MFSEDRYGFFKAGMTEIWNIEKTTIFRHSIISNPGVFRNSHAEKL
jgi:hypothetical protein